MISKADGSAVCQFCGWPDGLADIEYNCNGANADGPILPAIDTICLACAAQAIYAVTGYDVDTWIVKQDRKRALNAERQRRFRLRRMAGAGTLDI